MQSELAVLANQIPSKEPNAHQAGAGNFQSLPAENMSSAGVNFVDFGDNNKFDIENSFNFGANTSSNIALRFGSKNTFNFKNAFNFGCADNVKR